MKRKKVNRSTRRLIEKIIAGRQPRKNLRRRLLETVRGENERA
jgi:hypothetical protein